jgi:hypothetical protein
VCVCVCVCVCVRVCACVWCACVCVCSPTHHNTTVRQTAHDAVHEDRSKATIAPTCAVSLNGRVDHGCVAKHNKQSVRQSLTSPCHCNTELHKHSAAQLSRAMSSCGHPPAAMNRTNQASCGQWVRSLAHGWDQMWGLLQRADGTGGGCATKNTNLPLLFFGRLPHEQHTQRKQAAIRIEPRGPSVSKAMHSKRGRQI